MRETVITLENLSKCYRIGTAEQSSKTLFGKISNTLLQPIIKFRQLRKLTSFNGKEDKDIIWALRNVTFEVKEGDIVGVIGRNGAGKTTLLKILSRISAPTHGSFELIGNVTSLLEVGTGFHPELTGRENVYLNGAILGMKKEEIYLRFDEIIDFSGIEKYLDTPVKRYSSGMRMRLAFSVAAHLNSDILLVDEVLAVGDLEFQMKCLKKMGEIGEQNRTILFVSHNIGTVRSLCSKGIYLVNGQISKMGEIDFVCNQYLKDIQGEEGFYSDNRVKIKINLKDEKGNRLDDWRYLEWLIIEVEVESTDKIRSPAVDLSFYSSAGIWIAALKSDMMTKSLSGKSLESFKMVFRLQNPGLTVNELYLNVGLRNREDRDKYGNAIYFALVQYAAVIPVVWANLPRPHIANTICNFPAEVKTEL